MDEDNRKAWLQSIDFCVVGGLVLGFGFALLTLYMGSKVENPWAGVLFFAAIFGWFGFRIGRFIVCRLR